MRYPQSEVNNEPKNYAAILAQLQADSVARDEAQEEWEANHKPIPIECVLNPVEEIPEIKIPADWIPCTSLAREKAPPPPAPEKRIHADDRDDYIAKLEAQIAKQETQLAKLEAQLKKYEQPKTPSATLPFHQNFRGLTDRIVKLRIDLFDNADAGKGAARYKATLFVWLDTTEGQTGSIVPAHFPLTYRPETWDFKGHLVWKGPAMTRYGVKGTINVKDHLCFVEGDTCRVSLDGFKITLDEHDPDPDGVAVKRWYWNR